MAEHLRSGASADVQITITVVPRRRRTSLRGRGVGVGVAVAVLGAVGAGVIAGGSPHDPAGLAGVAAAYGYPSRCLSVTISPSAPAYAQAQVVRRRDCPPYRGYVDATFHRVDGTWRLVLDEGQLFVPNRLLARCRSAWPSCRARSLAAVHGRSTVQMGLEGEACSLCDCGRGVASRGRGRRCSCRRAHNTRP